MGKIISAAILTLFCLAVHAQTKPATSVKSADSSKLYNPNADAKADIKAAVQQAAATNKNVLLQIGGNWCIWCLRFNSLVTGDAELDNYVRSHYVVVHVNYSPENTNDSVLASLGYPQRFGFPVFVVLDGKGARLHTQNSEYLEDGKGHSKTKVMGFFKGWSTEALDPKSYMKKQ